MTIGAKKPSDKFNRRVIRVTGANRRFDFIAIYFGIIFRSVTQMRYLMI